VSPRAGALSAALLLACAAPGARVVRPLLVPALALESVGPVRATPEALYGRVLVVSFMATWCFPCIEELPDFVALQRQYGGPGFTVVLVGMDLEGARVLEPFADYYQLPFPLLVADDRIRDGESPFGRLAVLPTTLVIGRDGRPAAAVQGIVQRADLAREIEKALAAP